MYSDTRDGNSHHLKITAVCAFACVVISSCYVWRAHHYPYGWSHSCDKQLMAALQNYADTHGGAFPANEATPEASLSLLFRAGLANAEVLRGKSIPYSVANGILDRGELLGPDSCGWHYVEGLRLDDDPRIAIFWDKAGLDHNGGRMSDSGHIVWFVKWNNPYIPASEWPNFLVEQERLLKERAKKKNEATDD